MPAITFTATVSLKRFITPTVFELDFTSDHDFEFQGGQFVSIIVPGKGPGGRDLRRAYSFLSTPEKRPYRLCIKLVEGGPGTQYLNNLSVGETFKAMAPYGNFVLKTADQKSIFFISTGTGIAPYCSMLLSKSFERKRYNRIISLFGVRHESELLYVNEMQSVPDHEFYATVSQPSAGYVGMMGRVTDYLRANLNRYQFTNTEYYLCGNGAMIDEVKQILATQGVEKTFIHQEVYYK